MPMVHCKCTQNVCGAQMIENHFIFIGLYTNKTFT